MQRNSSINISAPAISAGASAPDTVIATPYRFVIETILFLTYMVFGTTLAAAGAFLKEMMAELHLSLSEASFVNTSVSIAKIFGPLLAGVIAVRIGLKKAFLLASCLICLGIFAPFAPDYPLFILARFAMGLGGALTLVYFTPIVMQWFPEEERIVVNGLNFISLSVGMMMGFYMTDSLMAALGGSWRKTLLIYSGVSIILAILWLILGKDKDNGTSQEDKKLSRPSSLAGYWEAVKDPNTWKITLTYAGTLCHYMVIITFLPTFYKSSHYFLPDSPVMKAPAILMLAGIPAVLVGITAGKIFKLRIPIIRIAGIILVPSALGMFIFHNELAVLICAVATGFGMFMWRSPLFTIPQELPGMTSEKSAYMMSVFWPVSYIATTIAVWGVGKITEITGSFIPGFTLVSLLAGSLFVGSFFIPETGPGRTFQHVNKS